MNTYGSNFFQAPSGQVPSCIFFCVLGNSLVNNNEVATAISRKLLLSRHFLEKIFKIAAADRKWIYKDISEQVAKKVLHLLIILMCKCLDLQ